MRRSPSRPPTVLKIGGGDDLDLPDLCRQVGRLRDRGHRVLIVHGGGRALSANLSDSGVESRFVDGLRYTDDAVRSAAVGVFAGTVNKKIVAELSRARVLAVGICGIDGQLITVVPEQAGRLGWVGEIVAVNPTAINLLLDAEITPVVAPLGLDANGQIYNVNADTVAGRLARELGAAALVLASNVPGVLDRSGALVERITPDVARRLVDEGAISGGMIPKLAAALDLLDAVGSVHIVDGARAGAVEAVLAGRPGSGTQIIAEDG